MNVSCGEDIGSDFLLLRQGTPAVQPLIYSDILGDHTSGVVFFARLLHDAIYLHFPDL